MNLKSSPIVGAVAVVVAALCLIAVIRSCGQTGTTEVASRKVLRHCLACGHEWRMDVKEALKQQLEDPTGNAFVRCPECGAWRGVVTTECRGCGKVIPRIMARELEDGTVVTWENLHCEECAEKQGGTPDSESTAPSDTEE